MEEKKNLAKNETPSREEIYKVYREKAQKQEAELRKEQRKQNKVQEKTK